MYMAKEENKIKNNIKNIAYFALYRSNKVGVFKDLQYDFYMTKEEIINILKGEKFSILSCEVSTYDTPFKGAVDLIGGLSLSLYKKLSNWITGAVLAELNARNIAVSELEIKLKPEKVNYVNNWLNNGK